MTMPESNIDHTPDIRAPGRQEEPVEAETTTESATSEEEELRRMAFTDELTGLYNRRFMKTRVPNYILMAKKAGGAITLAMLDLDGFKGINDTYGHMTGDQVLVNFAKTINECVGDKGITIRYAGDEFTVVFLNIEKQEAKNLMDELVETLDKTIIDVGGSQGIKVNVSIGLANFPHDAQDYETLFKRADEALYHAKGAGKNRAIAYPDEGKLVAPGNISTLFPVERTVGFDDILAQLKLVTIDRITGKESKPELPILCGPRGGGKTRLLKELAKEAENRGYGVIDVTGQAGFNRPYYALVEAFGKVMRRDRTLLRELAEELDFSEKTELTKDIPELADVPNPPDDGGGEDRDTVIFKALNKLIFGLLRKSRQVFIVDDARLMDNLSMGFIDSFIAEFPQSNLDIVFAINTDTEQETEAGIMHILSGMNKTAQLAEVTRLIVPPLGPAHIADMLYQITGKIDIPEDILERLAERTSGNPLFIEELLKLIIERGIVLYDGANWTIRPFSTDDLPDSLDDILAERAEQLSDEDKEILKQAAVIGESFSVEVLSKLTGTSEQEVMDILERARKAYIIREDFRGESDYVFNSASTRNVFYDLWDEEERKDVHMEVAEAEMELHPDSSDEIFGKLVYHFQQAERWDKAAQVIALVRERDTRARIPEATRRLLQRRAYIDDMARESSLEKEDIGKAIKTLRDIRVAIQSLRLYPRENENVAKSIVRAFEGISYFFDKTEVLTFSINRETVLVNGQPPSPENADERLASEFYDLISPYNLQGFVFLKGLTENEIGDFFEIMKRKPDEVVDSWDQLLKEENIVHIKPDRKIYVAVGERKVVLGQDRIEVETAKKASGGDSEISEKVLQQVEKLLDDFREESSELLKALEEGVSPEKDFDRLMSVLREVSGYLPSQPTQTQPATATTETEKPTETTEQEPLPETQVDAETKPVKPPVPPPPPQHLRQQDIGAEGQILPEPVVPERSETGPTFGEFSPVQEWLEDLKADDRVVKARAVQNLVRIGVEAVEPCINGILENESPRFRRLLAMIVARIGRVGVNAFAQSFARDWRAETMANLISVADIFSDDPTVRERLKSLILSHESVVRDSVVEVLANFPDEVKQDAVKTAIESTDIAIKTSGVRAVGILGLKELSSLVTSSINKKAFIKSLPNTDFAIAAMKTAGELGDTSLVEPLEKIAKPNSFLTIGKSLPDNIRIEAINVLGKIGTKEAFNALKRLIKSRNNAIKTAAKAALESIAGG